MEYQGIVTGIGGKDTSTNLIKPEYDAILNDFIIDKNTILEGLELSGKNISAGACVLCGYRGIIDTPKELEKTAYVYGEFTLNSIYGGGGEDSFDIVGTTTPYFTNVDVTEITSAGTYYLLLYANGEKQVDIYEENGEEKELGEYPLNAQYSVETENVVGNATIDSEVEGVTQLPNDNSNKIATTQYVRNQIEEEIDYEKKEIDVYFPNTSNIVAKLTLKRKSKYVIAEITDIPLGTYIGVGAVFVQLPNGFIPIKREVIMFSRYLCEITTEGKIKSLNVDAEDVVDSETFSFGYECQ